MATYIPIEKQSVEDIWPKISEWVQESLLGDITLHSDDLKALCVLGHCELWGIFAEEILTGFLIGRIAENPHGRFYYAGWFGGRNVFGWAKEAYEALKVHAKNNDCLLLNIVGPLAWQKTLGIKPKGVYYSVEL